ncbi:MAG: hypothetical protein DDT21_01890 [Syntrophomonadaceae bacterium]|nr:hypothetical protein [Bacillota bacterium]
MSLDDLYNNIAGNLNLLDTLEGVIRGLFYGDMGYRFVIRRRTKDGAHSLEDCRAMLKERGVDTFWFGFDSQNMYFRVKNRQAKWAEYILLRAGVELLNPVFDNRNVVWASQPKHNDRPVPSWTQQAKKREEQRSQRRASSWLDKLLG